MSEHQPSAATLYKLLALTMERSGFFRQLIDRRPKRKLRGWRIKAAMGRAKDARCYFVGPGDSLGATAAKMRGAGWLT